jgi:hypothetical protein
VLKPVRLVYPVHPDPVHGVQQGEIGNGLRMWELPQVLNRKVSRLRARMSPAPPIQGGAGDGLQKTRISDRLSFVISQVTDAGIVSQAVRPATPGSRVAPIAPSRSVSGRMVVRRRPTCDGPTSGLPSSRRMSREARIRLRFGAAHAWGGYGCSRAASETPSAEERGHRIIGARGVERATSRSTRRGWSGGYRPRRNP